MTTGKLAGIWGSVAAVLTAIALWQSVDWQKVADSIPLGRSAHAADIETLRGEYTLSENRIIAAIELSNLEWRCDEWEEELDELLDLQHRGDDSPQLAEDIRRLRKRISDNDCDQFED